MREQTIHKNVTFLWVLLTISLIACKEKQVPRLSIITDTEMGKPVANGLASLTSDLEEQNIPYETVSSLAEARGGILLVTGLSGGGGEAAKLLQQANHQMPAEAEALTIWRTEVQQKPAWVINGFDDRGLMYGLLDVAERVSWSTDRKAPLSEVEAITEKPDVGTRAISMYTMNRRYWETRFYDEVYWERYMDLLAKNRFNSLVVIFGYENGGFLAPCYPYFFNVDGFPGTGMEGMTASEQQRNISALNQMIEMAHERGLEFKVAIWDHSYRGGVQTGGISEEDLTNQSKNHLVQGLNAENLSEYTKAALAKFIQVVPHLDGIQMRMHNESGLKRGEEMEVFWTEVFGMIKTTAPGLQIDLRAKELPETIIQIAINTGLNFTITTKYWMEQMGLPFHPTHINRQNQYDRRHGYADMLYYPREYRMHWRLWSGGTQRILLWGDPQYVRRFAESTHLYDGDGFEINEPLATKMEAQAHDAETFNLLTPPYVYYDYEFERYWHFFQVFGRLAYNPQASPELWSREFERRFGPEAGPIIQDALHKASEVLPRIVAACSPYSKFPTTRGWAAKQRFGDLPDYADAEGSDIQQFASFDAEARQLIEGGETARRLPSATSLWFQQVHQEIDELISKARASIPDEDNREFVSTITDLSILSNLALYHSHRIPAAVSYRIFERSKDPHALDDAIDYESKAIEAWRKIVVAAGDVYAPDLMMGVREAGHRNMKHHLSGHWKDELAYLEKGLEQIQAKRKNLEESGLDRTAPAYKAAPDINYQALLEIQHQAVRAAAIGQAIQISASVRAPAGVRWVRLRYRSVNQHLDYQTLAMEADMESDVYKVTVPASHIDTRFDFMYFIEVMDDDGHGRIYPDLEVETPYIIVELER
jgi:hypothetical protein